MEEITVSFEGFWFYWVFDRGHTVCESWNNYIWKYNSFTRRLRIANVPISAFTHSGIVLLFRTRRSLPPKVRRCSNAYVAVPWRFNRGSWNGPVLRRSHIAQSWTWKIAIFQTLKIDTKINDNHNFFTVVIKRKRKLILEKRGVSRQWVQ